MSSDPPPDLLIVGGLAVDHFPDGSSAPGGTVLHAGLAAAGRGVRVETLTVCGDEPEARDGLSRLAELGPVVRQPAAASCTYRHDERGPRRLLVYDRATDPLRADTIVAARPAAVALAAPIADELPPPSLRALREQLHPERIVALIQGWLRRLDIGRPVAPLELGAVVTDLWAELAWADAVVVSREDLPPLGNGDPLALADALRARIGRRPVLIVTEGVDGYLLDDPSSTRPVACAPRRVVTGVATVGAGDTFGVVFAIELARGATPLAAAEAAADGVIRMLEARRA
jgi:sugar/nucleoside kinase (ribokinase family)